MQWRPNVRSEDNKSEKVPEGTKMPSVLLPGKIAYICCVAMCRHPLSSSQNLSEFRMRAVVIELVSLLVLLTAGLTKFSLSELEAATDSFSVGNIIGTGGSSGSTVFKVF